MKTPLVHGIGVNDVGGRTCTLIGGKRVMCEYYCRWKAMLRRVTTLTNYKDCKVCEEWLIFSNFKAWMKEQDWKGKHLDKDLLKGGGTLYSPHTCMFVPQYVNSIVRCFNNRNGVTGVYKDKSGKFRVCVYIDNKQYYGGTFRDKIDAQNSWVDLKRDLVLKDLQSKGYSEYYELLDNYFKIQKEKINGTFVRYG